MSMKKYIGKDPDDCTSYPETVDERLFFSGMRLRDSEVYDTYKSKIDNKEYDEASECLQDSDADYYGAFIFNLFQGQLFEIEEKIRTTVDGYGKLRLVNYSSNPYVQKDPYGYLYPDEWAHWIEK